jgi:hypothetical protein
VLEALPPARRVTAIEDVRAFFALDGDDLASDGTI